jgi:hypothetical protein
MSNLFQRCPEYFGYGIFTARKPRSNDQSSSATDLSVAVPAAA